VAGAAVVVVLLALTTLIVIKVAGGGAKSNDNASPAPSSAALSQATLVALTGVPAGVLDQVGTGSATNLPKKITGQTVLTEGGKPLVVYIGAEYCPFCAAQRWPLVVALSRFGTFTNLTKTHSGSDDVFPDTPTVSFHGATYTSQYLVFQGVETATNQRKGNSYAPLDTLTAQQQNLLATYDAPPYVATDAKGSIPFLDFANQNLVTGASLDPKLLAGKSVDEVAAALADPSTPIAKAVGGAANAFTATLCKLTGNQPAAVCGSAAVTAYNGKV
jgi:hypothetical protein